MIIIIRKYFFKYFKLKMYGWKVVGKYWDWIIGLWIVEFVNLFGYFFFKEVEGIMVVLKILVIL